MIYSMTGFAAQQSALAGGALLLELRAVNHRYLELHLRVDEALRGFEMALREAIHARLARGKVECRLAFTLAPGAVSAPRLDAAKLETLAELEAAVRARLPHSAPLAVADILRWPGMLGVEEAPGEIAAEEVMALLSHALDELEQARGREGEKLREVILERVAAIETRAAQVKPLLPTLLQAYQQKLTARLREAIGNVDEERLRQELILFAQKMDVDEELSRLGAHLQEVRRILAGGGAVGKRLDFLMQELNREANTLGSKSVSTEISQAAMDIKVLIEQMREQIQNIE